MDEFPQLYAIPNQLDHLGKAREFVRQAVKASKLDNDQLNKVVLAIDEAVSNIIEHAYKEGSPDRIEITVDSNDQALIVIITDHGNHFNPGTVPDIDMETHLKARNKGGLGIFLMRQIMDEIEYNFKDGVRNELRLVKYYKERS